MAGTLGDNTSFVASSQSHPEPGVLGYFFCCQDRDHAKKRIPPVRVARPSQGVLEEQLRVKSTMGERSIKDATELMDNGLVADYPPPETWQRRSSSRSVASSRQPVVGHPRDPNCASNSKAKRPSLASAASHGYASGRSPPGSPRTL